MVFIKPVSVVFADFKTADSAAQLVSNATDDLTDTPHDDRPARLKVYLLSFAPRIKSSLADETEFIVSEADKYSVDWRLVVAIAGAESTFCRNIPANSNNCWGWGIPTGAKSGLEFTNIREGITVVTRGLREKYIDKGLITIEQIGKVYAASPAWSHKIRYFLDKIENHESGATEPTELTI